jgi:protein-disulfide isomerase
LPQIEKDYITTGKVVYIFKNFPLSFHAQAQLAAETAECAGAQGQFWTMHDQLYLHQSEWADNDGALSIFLGYGRLLGLDQDAFQACLGNHEMAQKVRDDYAFGQSVGVPSTPSFVINGKGMPGANPYSTFQQVIDAALKAAQP